MIIQKKNPLFPFFLPSPPTLYFAKLVVEFLIWNTKLRAVKIRQPCQTNQKWTCYKEKDCAGGCVKLIGPNCSDWLLTLKILGCHTSAKYIQATAHCTGVISFRSNTCEYDELWKFQL